MLVIRQTQLETFGQDNVRRFEERLVAWLGEEFPETYGPEQGDAALKLVRMAIRTGAPLGVESQGALTGYVALMAEYGEKFERTPDGGWGREILQHPSLPGDLKIGMISKRFEARTQGRRIVRTRASEAG